MDQAIVVLGIGMKKIHEMSFLHMFYHLDLAKKNTSPLWRQQKKVLIFPGFSMEYFSISLHFTASIDATSYHHPRSSRFYTNFF
jgi:hypothetical protein